MPLSGLLPLLAATAATPATDCAALIGTVGDVVVDQATAVTPAPEWKVAGGGVYTAMPVKVPFCRIEGRIEGNIGFELWLPTQWNGRMLGAGVGGDAGVFNYRDMSLRVAQGFATVTTDSGHKASQARWMSEAKARVDYEHRAVHLTAQAAKALINRFYAKPVNRSYFLGCSGGGRQALKEMQQYPGDYDGVVAGAPGPYMPLQSVRMLWFSLEQARKPEAMLSEADWALYENRATAACDANDGVRDGIVTNPLACKFKTATLLCRKGQTDQCLTPAKRTMLDYIIAPMRDEQGRKMDTGLVPAVRTRPGPPSPLLRAMWADAVYNDANWNADTFRRTADLDAANRIMPQLRADSTAIQPFIARGSKAIIYQGWQDPSTNAGPTLTYYSALARAHGGVESLDDTVRLFMVPGMYHCRGGPGADNFGGSGHIAATGEARTDILSALIDWVEGGKAPERIEASGTTPASGTFTRALCPYPQSARWDGKGPQDKASSYTCKSDPLLVRLLRG